MRKGQTHSPEARVKNSAAHLGRTYSPETRAKMSAAQMGHPVSPETRAQIGAASRGKKLSPETRAKIGDANRGQRKATIKGYRSVWVRGKANKEHRAMVEEALSQPLQPGEVVHHANGDKHDNRLENFEVCVDNAEHTAGHARERRGAAPPTEIMYEES